MDKQSLSEKCKSILEALERNLVSTIWEVILAIVALLAVFLQEYQGVFWILVLVLALIAAIVGLLLRKSRWFPIFSFVTGLLIGITLVLAIHFPIQNDDGNEVPADTLSTPVEQLTSVPTPRSEETRLVLEPTWLEEDAATLALDGRATVLCDYVSDFTQTATFEIHFPDETERRFLLVVGESRPFVILEETYSLTLLRVENGQAQFSITRIGKEFLTPD